MTQSYGKFTIYEDSIYLLFVNFLIVLTFTEMIKFTYADKIWQIRRQFLSLSIALPCSAEVSPPINLQEETVANSIILDCGAVFLSDSSTCLGALIDKLWTRAVIPCAECLYLCDPVGYLTHLGRGHYHFQISSIKTMQDEFDYNNLHSGKLVLVSGNYNKFTFFSKFDFSITQLMLWGLCPNVIFPSWLLHLSIWCWVTASRSIRKNRFIENML